MQTTYLTPRTCPTCTCVIEAVTDAAGQQPYQPGDYTICIYCGQTLRFTPALTLQPIPMHQVPDKLWPDFDAVRMNIFARNFAGGVH